MLILPQNYFNIVTQGQIFPKIVPKPEALRKIKSLFNVSRVLLHGYKTRLVKQIGCDDRRFLIPRIILQGDKIKTHILLPEFILPYCNYTVKSLALVFPERVNQDVLLSLSLKQFDYLNSVSEYERSQKAKKYISNRLLYLRRKLQTIGSTYKIVGGINLLKAPSFKYFSNMCSTFRRYFIFDKKFLSINILRYFAHTISFFDSC